MVNVFLIFCALSANTISYAADRAATQTPPGAGATLQVSYDPATEKYTAKITDPNRDVSEGRKTHIHKNRAHAVDQAIRKTYGPSSNKEAVRLLRLNAKQDDMREFADTKAYEIQLDPWETAVDVRIYNDNGTYKISCLSYPQATGATLTKTLENFKKIVAQDYPHVTLPGAAEDLLPSQTTSARYQLKSNGRLVSYRAA